MSARGYEAFPGEGVGDDGEWPAEASLLILGMSRAEATALGHAHAQRAVVWGGVGESALLLICSQHPAESHAGGAAGGRAMIGRFAGHSRDGR